MAKAQSAAREEYEKKKEINKQINPKYKLLEILSNNFDINYFEMDKNLFSELNKVLTGLEGNSSLKNNQINQDYIDQLIKIIKVNEIPTHHSGLSLKSLSDEEADLPPVAAPSAADPFTPPSSPEPTEPIEPVLQEERGAAANTDPLGNLPISSSGGSLNNDPLTSRWLNLFNQ